MCGYCTELMAILALKSGCQDLPSDSAPLMGEVYLQEVRDLPEAFGQLGADNTLKPHFAVVIMCRAIEMLVHEGFQSAAYQELLRLPQFVSAISAACEVSAKAAINDTDSQLNPHDFAWLVNINTYLTPRCFEQHCAQMGEQSCVSLLNEYVGWWLEGGSIELQPSNQTQLDGDEGTPCVASTADYDLFDRRFPALWFALSWISTHSPSEAVIWDMVVRCPAGVVLFSGYDLWLQRRALLACYDQRGIAPLRENVRLLRTELLQFLAAVRIISIEDRQALIAALEGYESSHSGPTSEWYWAD